MSNLDVEKIFDICNKRFKEPFYKELESFEEFLKNIEKEIDFIQLYLKPRKNDKVTGENKLRLLNALERVNFSDNNMNILFNDYVEKCCDEETKKLIASQNKLFVDEDKALDNDQKMCSVIEGFLLHYKGLVLSKKDIKKLKVLLDINVDRVIPDSMINKICNSCSAITFDMFNKYNGVRNDYINVKIFLKKQDEAKGLSSKSVNESPVIKEKIIETKEIVEFDLVEKEEFEINEEEVSSYSRQVYEMMSQGIEENDILSMMPVEGSVNYYRVYSEVGSLLNRDICEYTELLGLTTENEDKAELIILLEAVNSNIDLLKGYYSDKNMGDISMTKVKEVK